MKKLLLSVAVLTLSAGVAMADSFAGLYGHTVNVTYPDGSSAKAYVNADGTWSRKLADGKEFSGTYGWKDPKTACFTQVTPPPAKPDEAVLCLPIDPHKVGDTWSSKDDKGAETKYSVTQGR